MDNKIKMIRMKKYCMDKKIPCYVIMNDIELENVRIGIRD